MLIWNEANAAMRRYLQAVTHPQWAWDVLNGCPHDLGRFRLTSANRPDCNYIGWLGNNFIRP